MAYGLTLLPPQIITHLWPELEAFAESAAERSSGRYTAAHIREFGEKGLWQLWLVHKPGENAVALCGTELITYPTGLKSVAIRFCAGHGREEWQHLVETILEQAKGQGCRLAEGAFRLGWRRVLPGWNHTHDYLERPL